MSRSETAAGSPRVGLGPAEINVRGADLLSPAVAAFLDAYDEGPGQDVSAATPDLRGSLARMQVLDNPFRCAVIDDFLPESLHGAVLQHRPSDSEFTLVSRMFAGQDSATQPDDYLGTRRKMLVQDWLVDGGREPAPPAMAAVAAALRAPRFVRALFTAFADTIESTLASIGATADGAANFRLYANLDEGEVERDALGAHIDSLRKLLTIVVYLDLSGQTTPDSPGLWGTTLYRADAGAVTPLAFSANADHEVVRQVQFLANRAYVMPNGTGALHGVPGGQPAVERRTLMCGYWLVHDTSAE